MDNIIDFFQKNRNQISGFIDEINVNNSKTVVKLGYIENKSVNIAFAIYSELDKSIVGFDEKLKCLLNTDFNIKDIENQLHTNRACTIHFTPFLKISNTPVIHAFQMNINYEA